MSRRLPAFLIVASLFAGTLPAMAQQAAPARVSPHETISAHIGDARSGPLVTIVYGRPYSKDPKAPATIRKIWGTLVPWEKVWRLGSDESTMLITQVPLQFGDTTVPAGAYSLYMFPSETGSSKLIINKALGQWGIPYSAAIQGQELARIDLKKDPMEKQVDEFTIVLENSPATGGGIIKLQWENTQYSVPFTVKK